MLTSFHKSNKHLIRYTYEVDRKINNRISNNIRKQLFNILKEYYINKYCDGNIYLIKNGNIITITELITKIRHDLYNFKKETYTIVIPCNILKKNILIKYDIKQNIYKIIDLLYQYNIMLVLENKFELLHFFKNDDVCFFCKRIFNNIS